MISTSGSLRVTCVTEFKMNKLSYQQHGDLVRFYFKTNLMAYVMKSIKVAIGSRAWLRKCLNSVTNFSLSLSSITDTFKGPASF